MIRLVLGALILACGLLVPHRQAQAETHAHAETLDYAVPGNPSQKGIGVHFAPESVLLWSCEKACTAGKAQLTLEIPKEARGLPRQLERLQVGPEKHLLLIRYGDDERYFSWLLLAAPSGADVAPPRLLLKGWTQSEQGGLSVVADDEEPTRKRVLVLGEPVDALCGRKVPAWVRHFDPKQEEFRRARIAPLSEGETEQAPTQQATPVVVESGEVLLRLVPEGSHSAGVPVDGVRSIAWNAGHEFSRMRLPPGKTSTVSRGDRLVFQFERPPASEAPLWVVTEQQVLAVTFTSDSTLQQIPLPEGALSSCLALVQPGQPLPLTEAMLLRKTELSQNLVDLVKRLDSAEPGDAAAALLLRGDPAARALASVYKKLGPPGRLRTQELASHFHGAGGSLLLATIAAHGEEKARERALLELGARDVEVDFSASQVLVELDETNGLPLADWLLKRDPKSALRATLELLDEEAPGARALGRSMLLHLRDSAEGGDLVDELLDAEGQKGLSARVLIELARSVGPDERLLTELLPVATAANFEQAYLLVPVVAPLSGRKPWNEIYAGWLAGRLPHGTNKTKSSALSVRAVEALLEVDAAVGAESSSAEAVGSEKAHGGLFDSTQLLNSSNVRVREAGLSLIEHVSEHMRSVSSKPPLPPSSLVMELLKKDSWPRVRSAAARALGALSVDSRLPTEERERLAGLMAQRLKRDQSERVRRSLARAASGVKSDKILQALRRALSKDQSYAVRADAALSLGDLCDQRSLEALTRRAHALSYGALDEGEVSLGLAAVSALILLNPSDLEARLAPLRTDHVPGPLRVRVESRLSAGSVAKACNRL